MFGYPYSGQLAFNSAHRPLQIVETVANNHKFMLRGGPPPPDPNAGGNPYAGGSAGGMPGGFEGFSSANMGGMPRGGKTFHFENGSGSFGGGGGGFNFSNPESIFAEFLKQQGGGGGGSGGADGFEDIFAGLGGGRGGGGRSRRAQFGGAEPAVQQRRATTPEVTTVERPLALTLEELFKGCHKKMKIKRKAYDETTGKRTTQDKILEMDIKAGLKKGSKIKFKGVGDQEEGGQQDLHFIIEEVCSLSSLSAGNY